MMLNFTCLVMISPPSPACSTLIIIDKCAHNEIGDVQHVNNKDLAHFRRYLKPETELMKIYDIFNVYVTKESSEIYHHECHPFAMLEKEQQELFLGNFKKNADRRVR